MRTALFSFLTKLATHHGRTVLVVCGVLCLLSVYSSAGLEIKTNFKDVLGSEDPIAIQQAYVESNFPGLSTVQVVIHGNDRDEIVAVAKEIEERTLDKPEFVSAVYLEQPIDFFLAHGLLYQSSADLRSSSLALDEWKPMLSALLADPSSLGMLRMLTAISQEMVQSSSAVIRVSSRMFGHLLLDQPQRGTGMAMDLEIDPSSMMGAFHENLLNTMESIPLPGSEEATRGTLRHAQEGLSLLADALDQGERMTPEIFAVRSQKLRELGLARVVALTRTEWSAIRAKMGRRRRFSASCMRL